MVSMPAITVARMGHPVQFDRLTPVTYPANSIGVPQAALVVRRGQIARNA
jgi:hypothetical protein